MPNSTTRPIFEAMAVFENLHKAVSFNDVLRQNSTCLRPEAVSLDVTNGSTTCRAKVKVDPSICLWGSNSISLSTYLALIDNVTTMNHIGANLLNPAPSIMLQVERVPSSTEHLLPPREVEIISKLVKAGRKMVFLRAEVRNGDTGDLICFGTHVKLMGTGSKFLDLCLDPWFWPLTSKFFQMTKRPHPNDKDLASLKEAIIPYLKHTGEGRAVFRVQSAHCNPLGFSMEGLMRF